jgi:hypothetical protein
MKNIKIKIKAKAKATQNNNTSSIITNRDKDKTEGKDKDKNKDKTCMSSIFHEESAISTTHSCTLNTERGVNGKDKNKINQEKKIQDKTT